MDHVAGLSLGFLGERKDQPLARLSTTLTTAPTSALGATTVHPQGPPPPEPCQGESDTASYRTEVCCGQGYRRVMADGDSEQRSRAER